jgi:tRNA threonylcarbamoyladenosine biosynthesis protein TsaB
MPTLIAFDTSSDTASVSLMLRDGSIRTRASSGVVTHSQTILPMIQGLLDEAGIRLAECAAIAFGCGPGSITGVRTACGVAQGLAFGAELPLVPIVSLLAMAESCYSKHGVANVLAIMDARMKEVYWAQYSREENGNWLIIAEPRVSTPEAVVAAGEPVACGNGLAAYAEAFSGLPVAARYADIQPDSAAIATLASVAWRRGETIAARDAHPLYLRNKVAYTTRERSLMKGEMAA